MSQRHDRGGGSGFPRGGRQQAPPRPTAPPTFEPTKPLAELVDALAETQANMMPSPRDRGAVTLKSSQLRRFFGEAKDLYNRWRQGTDYASVIEPQFKMLRSKAQYAWRNGDRGQSKIPQEFLQFIDNGVSKVTNEDQFSKFILHFEAVVGFLYGTGKVGK
jgi:CRISPR type III-A-associated protein Csm2